MAMFPVLGLRGQPYERGLQHGREARVRVERSLRNYRDLFEFCRLPWDEAQRRAAPYRDVIGGLDPALLEEMEGIAKGAERPFGEILALNVRTEILPPGFMAGRDVGECTSIAVAPRASATGGALLAQNWDWVGVQRESLVLLRFRGRHGQDCLTLTEGGMLAKIGCNAAGFGVCLNILRSKRDGEKPGAPVHVFLRMLLDCRSVAEAVALASRLSFAGSSNAHCADRGGDAAALECSPYGLRVLRGERGTLCHTNHFVDPSAKSWEGELSPALSTESRLACAEQHAAARAKHGVEDLKRLLRDESDGLTSICRHPDRRAPPQLQIESVASVIMELDRGVMHVAPDVPSRCEYATVSVAAEAVPA